MSTETLGTSPFLWVNKAYVVTESTKVAESPPCRPPKLLECSGSTFSSATQLPLPADMNLIWKKQYRISQHITFRTIPKLLPREHKRQ